jgi:hypothetical protein
MMRLEDFGWNLGPPPEEVRVEKYWVTEPLGGWYPSVGIGKPGCVAHLRKGELHALDMGDHWLLHRDRVDPAKDPIGHLAQDAPVVGVAMALVGLVLLAALLSD